MLNIRSSADCWSLQALHAVRLFNRHDSRHSLHIKGSSDRRSEPTLRIFSQSSTALKKKFCCGNKRCSGCVFFFQTFFECVCVVGGQKDTAEIFIRPRNHNCFSGLYNLYTVDPRKHSPGKEKKKEKEKWISYCVKVLCAEEEHLFYLLMSNAEPLSAPRLTSVQ